jgi:hypothetical protein
VKNKRVYKVVKTLEYGQLVSAFARGEFMVRYELGKEAKAEVGKIFAFSSMECASTYVEQNCTNVARVVIMEGMATNPEIPKFVCGWSADYKSFWRRKKGKRMISNLSEKPYKGTVLCDSFTPDRIVAKVALVVL